MMIVTALNYFQNIRQRPFHVSELRYEILCEIIRKNTGILNQFCRPCPNCFPFSTPRFLEYLELGVVAFTYNF